MPTASTDGARPRRRHTVQLTLIDVGPEVECDPDGPAPSSPGAIIAALLDEALRDCRDGRAFLHSSCASGVVVRGNGDETLGERMKGAVKRFVRSRDRYAAIASLLLKSRSFYQTHSLTGPARFLTEGGDGGGGLPVVELPRTDHRKPYVPVGGGETTAKEFEGEEDVYPISVSHQHPHVGIARLVVAPSRYVQPPEPILRPPLEGHGLRVGLDIVMFEPYNPRLYKNQGEFLDVFKKSFTRWEWDRIRTRRERRVPDDPEEDEDSDGGRGARTVLCCKSFSSAFERSERRSVKRPRTETDELNEFYCRWSMKEAYTKALGVGMGLDFQTFETRLSGLDDDVYDSGGPGDSDRGIWGAATGGGEKEKGWTAKGRVARHVADTRQAKQTEVWDFHFLPLHSQRTSSSSDGGLEGADDEGRSTKGWERMSSSISYDGCACVCVGPIIGRDNDGIKECNGANDDTLELIVEWMSLKELVQWHQVA